MTRFSFRFDGKIIVIDKQKLRVQHDQTSFIRNVKEISLRKKKNKPRNIMTTEGKIKLVTANIQ